MQIEETQYLYNFKDKENFLTDDEYILKHKIKKILYSIVKKEGYRKYKINKRIFKDTGNGFLGVLCEADINGETDDCRKETNIFAKFKSPSDNIKILSISDAYAHELYVYKELSKVIEDLQDEFDVPECERYKFAKVYEESDKDAIVMENLSRKGYRISHRMELISLDFAEISIKELAKFHALSFVLQKKRPIYFNRKLANIKQPIIFNEDWNSIVINVFKATSSYLNDDLKKRLDKFLSKHLEMYKKYLEDVSTICCLCHGDYRAANIMKKEVEGKIIQILPIDYQLIYYGSPIHDLLYFIFSATDQKFRRDNLEYLKEYYYENLKSFLLYFDIDVETVFPRIDFEKVYKDRLDYGLMVSLILVPFILASDEAVPELSGIEEVEFNNVISDECKKRMVGLIEDFVEWGYL